MIQQVYQQQHILTVQQPEPLPPTCIMYLAWVNGQNYIGLIIILTAFFIEGLELGPGELMVISWTYIDDKFSITTAYL